MIELRTAWMVALVLWTGGPVSGKEPPLTRWRVQVEFRAIAVPLPKSVPLVNKLRRPDAAESDFRGLDEMVIRGEAELVGYALCIGEPGIKSQNVTTEQIQFSSEAEPPHPPENYASVSPPIQIPPWYAGAPVSGPLYPNQFDSRFVGTELAAEAQVSENGTQLTLTTSATLSRLREWRKFESLPSPLGIVGLTDGPLFEIRRTSETTFTVFNRRTALISTSILEQPPRLLLFLIRATATPVHP